MRSRTSLSSLETCKFIRIFSAFSIARTLHGDGCVPSALIIRCLYVSCNALEMRLVALISVKKVFRKRLKYARMCIHRQKARFYEQKWRGKGATLWFSLQAPDMLTP